MRASVTESIAVAVRIQVVRDPILIRILEPLRVVADGIAVGAARLLDRQRQQMHGVVGVGGGPADIGHGSRDDG